MLKRSRSASKFSVCLPFCLASQFSVCLPFCSASFFFPSLLLVSVPTFFFSLPKMSSPFSHYVLPFFSPSVEPKTCCPSSAQHVLIPKPKSLSLSVRAFPFQFRPLSKPKGTRFSCQLPRPKIFSLDASHFFYLNKSLFSSNLE